MMLASFGVQLPSLSSVLSFKVEGMEEFLPLRKVTFKRLMYIGGGGGVQTFAMQFKTKSAIVCLRLHFKFNKESPLFFEA